MSQISIFCRHSGILQFTQQDAFANWAGIRIVVEIVCMRVVRVHKQCES